MASLMGLRGDDRGQLLLVGAFILAILLVALAVVLNAAIYTETLAARGNDRADVFDTVQYRDDTERALSGLVAGVNDDATASRTTTETELRDGVSDWDAITARQQAATGRATTVTVTDVEVLTNVSQTNATRSLVSSSNDTEWTLVENVTASQSFVLDVVPVDTGIAQSDATNVSVLESSAFHVDVDTDDGTTWQVFVYRSPWNASNATVAVHSAGSVLTYNVTQVGDDPVEIDFVAATVEGTPVPALSFYGGVSGPHTVTFSNAADATGTYALLVDGDAADSADYSDGADGSPTARAVVTRLDVTLRYAMPNLEYETPISVTGGGDGV